MKPMFCHNALISKRKFFFLLPFGDHFGSAGDSIRSESPPATHMRFDNFLHIKKRHNRERVSEKKK